MIGNCAHCGSRVPANALKCPGCGSTEITSPDGSPRPAARRGSSRVAIGGVVVVLLPVGLVLMSGLGAGFFLFTRSDGGAPAPVGSGGFDSVRANGRFVVAADTAAPPFLSGPEGSYEGFEFALLAALADAAGAPLEIRPTPYDQLLEAVASGAVDAAVGQLPPEPRPGVAYTRSYLQYNLCLTVAPGSKVTSLRDLQGRTIGMYDDTTARGVVDAALGPAWVRRAYGDYGYFEDLAAGRLDAVVYDCPLTRHELGRSGAKLDVVDSLLGVATYSVAVAADREPLRQDIDRVLGELGSNGLLQQLASRWLGETPATDAPAARITVVRGGETLEQVAGRALGDPARASELLERNRDILGADPAAVYAGMQLRLP